MRSTPEHTPRHSEATTSRQGRWVQHSCTAGATRVHARCGWPWCTLPDAARYCPPGEKHTALTAVLASVLPRGSMARRCTSTSCPSPASCAGEAHLPPMLAKHLRPSSALSPAQDPGGQRQSAAVLCFLQKGEDELNRRHNGRGRRAWRGGKRNGGRAGAAGGPISEAAGCCLRALLLLTSCDRALGLTIQGQPRSPVAPTRTGVVV